MIHNVCVEKVSGSCWWTDEPTARSLIKLGTHTSCGSNRIRELPRRITEAEAFEWKPKLSDHVRVWQAERGKVR